jgi:hypothetical protein
MSEEAIQFTRTQLKERGWTEALVKKFLDPPDATRPNPHSKSAAPMRLYTASRVEAAESCEEWRRAAERLRVRSEAGKALAARKVAELVREAEQLPITVNSIRHHLSAYDTHLEEVAGRIGVSQAEASIRLRVYAEISATSPEYAEECQRQIPFRLLEVAS